MNHREHVFRLREVEKGIWELAESPLYISSDDAMTVADLASPIPGRVKFRLPGGEPRLVTVFFERLPDKMVAWLGASTFPKLAPMEQP